MTNSQQKKSQVSCSALVLAGGQSSRMGRDKALISWQGTPLLRRVCDVAVCCVQEVYILTPWAERYQAVVGDLPGFLCESRPGQGPLVALADGLRQMPPVDWVLLLACDLPQLQPAILQGWRDRLHLLPDDVLATVPQRNYRWEPLCAFYRPALKPQLESFIQQGGRSFQRWLATVAVQALPVEESEAQMLHNCNSPDDL